MGSKSSSGILQTAIGILVSLILLVWLAMFVNWAEVIKHLANVNYPVFVPAVAVIFVQFALRALRWRYLLGGDRHLPLRDLFDGIMLGNFGNYVFPLRAGEFIRPYLVSRNSKYSYSSCLVSVVIERFFDLSVVLICFGFLMYFLDTIPPLGDYALPLQEYEETMTWVKGGAFALSLLALGIMIFIIAGALIPSVILRTVKFFLHGMEKILVFFCQPAAGKIGDLLGRFVEDFLGGAAVLKSGRNLSAVVVLSLLVWLITILGYYVCLFLFPGMPYSGWLALSITVILALGVAAPSAPGFIGVFQIACVAGFILLGVSKELATAFALITHAMQYVVIIVYGVFLLFKYGLKMSELRHAGEGEEGESR